MIPLFSYFGFYAVYGTSILFLSIGLVFFVSHVKETIVHDSVSKSFLIQDFFRVNDVKLILAVIYRRRENWKHFMLWISYSIMVFGFGPNLGENV